MTTVLMVILLVNLAANPVLFVAPLFVLLLVALPALYYGSPRIIQPSLKGLLRLMYLSIGCIFTALAIFGAYTPLVPAIPFALVAAWCFKQSSPRLHTWLRNLKFIGPMLRDWEDHKRISLRSKKIALASIVLGFSYSIYTVNTLTLKLFLVILAIAVSTFILTRKSK